RRRACSASTACATRSSTVTGESINSSLRVLMSAMLAATPQHKRHRRERDARTRLTVDICGGGSDGCGSRLRLPARVGGVEQHAPLAARQRKRQGLRRLGEDRKSTRLNSSHVNNSSAVLCV